MGRPLIADPDLPNKLAAGRRDRVRPVRLPVQVHRLDLPQRPRALRGEPRGRPRVRASSAPARGPRYVVVVGGGPAGLECARRLAERGHRVELWEAGDAPRRTPGAGRAGRPRPGRPARLARRRRPGRRRRGPPVAARRPPPRSQDGRPARRRLGRRRHLGPRRDGSPGLGDLRDWLLGGDDPLGTTVAIRGGGKASVTIAGRRRPRRAPGHARVRARRCSRRSSGLPGRFRLVHDTEAAGVELRPGRRSCPRPTPSSRSRPGRCGRPPTSTASRSTSSATRPAPAASPPGSAPRPTSPRPL